MPDDSTKTTRRQFLEISAATLTGAATTSIGGSSNPHRDGGATLDQSAGSAPDLPALTIAAAANLLAMRRLSPVDLTEAVLTRIARLDSKVGAFITVAAEQAMDAARAAEEEIAHGRYRGPLHGVPVALKDTYYTRGIRTTAASPVLEDFVPDFDAAIVERLRAAGAILIGKLNLPEFSFGGYTPGSHNPWDLARNPGGSSGGSAAALAASMVLGAGGGDTSGSIRNPASACGVVGLKPTFGIVSRYGVIPISWTLDHLGPMAKTVQDTAILLQTMAGHDRRDNYSARAAVIDYAARLRRDVRGLRLGVISPAAIDSFHPDVKQSFNEAVTVLARLGAQLREITFPARMSIAGASQGIIRICEAAAYHRQYLTSSAVSRYLSDLGRSGPGTSRVRTTLEAGSLITAAQYLKAQRSRALFIDDMTNAYESIDALLSPTMPSPADVPTTATETYRNWWNLSGFPAVSVPCGFSTDPPGLPIGLQISARPFADDLVLGVAHAYESATRWHTRRPPL